MTHALYVKALTGVRVLGTLLLLAGVLLVIFAKRLSAAIQIAGGRLRQLGPDAVSLLPHRGDGRWHVIPFYAILAWATLLRLSFLGEPIRKDEAYTYLYYAVRPLWIGLTYYTANNHPLSTLLMHISTAAFGSSLWSVRLPTFAAGCLIVPLTYVAIRSYGNKVAALATCSLVAASSPLIEYSFNARGYSLGTAFLLVMITLSGLAIRCGSRGAWFVLPAAAALAIYSVPTMLFGVAGVFLYLFLMRRVRAVLFSVVAAVALTAALYSPMLAIVGLGAFTREKRMQPLPAGQWTPAFIDMAGSFWDYLGMDVPTLLGIGLILVVLAGLALEISLFRVPPWAILLGSLIVICVGTRIQHIVPPRRVFIYLVPLAFGTVGVGWGVLCRRFAGDRVNEVTAVAAVLVSVIMGSAVLSAKSLRHSGEESVGEPDAQAIVLTFRNQIQSGAQFVCPDGCDSSLDFQMTLQHVKYHPSTTGGLLIVIPKDRQLEGTLQSARISENEITHVSKAATIGTTDVYSAGRTPALPFFPTGNMYMGNFTSH